MSLLDALLDPVLNYEFMRNGLAAAIIVGVSSAVLSCLLVVRHQALLGDAISHSVLLGVVLGYLAAGTAGVLPGAMLVAVGAGVLITYVERNSPVKLDAVMGVCFTALFALGLAIVSVTRPRGLDLFHVLFGNVLGVSRGDLVLTAVSGVSVVVVVLALFRWFHLWTFDPLMAQATGIRVGALQYLFTALLSATVTAALQAVGLVLVVAMLITPGATALLFVSRLSRMMVVASLVGLISAVTGLYGSFYLDVASGPAIVLVATACFVVALLVAPRRGILVRALRRNRDAQRVQDEDLLKAMLDVPAAGLHPRRTRRLARQGLVTGERGAAVLSDAGRTAALRVMRAHRLVETFSHEAHGAPLHEVHGIADDHEHDLDGAAVEDMARMLGHPGTDPHGHPIPSAAGKLAAIAGRPLTEWTVGVPGQVTMVSDDRHDLLERMCALGILPSVRLVLLGHGPEAQRVRMGGRDLDVPTEIASRIFVSTT